MYIKKYLICMALLAFILTGCGLKNTHMDIRNSSFLTQNFCHEYSYGNISRGPNYEQAFYWCSRSSNDNIASGHVLLAELYLMGNYVAQDFEKARNLYRLAAQQDHPHAQFMMYQIYSLGLGTDINEQEALSWLKVAAENGSEHAEKELGLRIRDMD
ncbi:MAG: sel1 repeat family protein [Nitrospira sp.]|nr:sel1 repeat family protein [bacterium]MBL7048311.1 sel1 repeat family protein [Nitrospira sp.]